MAATSQNLTCFMGDTTVWPVHITEDGNNYDIRGHVLVWVISKTNMSTQLLQKEVVIPTTDDDGKNGISSWSLTPTDLETIGGPGNYWVTCIDLSIPDGETTPQEVTRVIKQLVVQGRISVSGFSGFSGISGWSGYSGTP